MSCPFDPKNSPFLGRTSSRDPDPRALLDCDLIRFDFTVGNTENVARRARKRMAAEHEMSVLLMKGRRVKVCLETFSNDDEVRRRAKKVHKGLQA